MKEFIKNLQGREDNEKAAFATIVAVLITVVLFVGWGYHFMHSDTIDNLANGASGVVESIDESSAFDKFGEAFSQMKDMVSTFGEDSDTQDAQASSEMQPSQINTFTNTQSNPQLPLQEYGENEADVLY